MNLATATAAEEAPAVLRPALAAIGGWKRLQRFAAAAGYPTLTTAAEIGIHPGPLIGQINRIERELGHKVLMRAERDRPMTLTPFGSQVVAAVNVCLRTGWRHSGECWRRRWIRLALPDPAPLRLNMGVVHVPRALKAA